MTAPGQHELEAGDSGDVVNPPAGFYALWVDTGGTAYLRDSSGVDVSLAGGGGGSVFGTEQQRASDEGESGTTSPTFQNKLTFSPTLVNGATYMVHFRYTWRHSNAASDFKGRIRSDGTDLFEHQQEPKDAGADQVHAISDWFEFTATADGVVDFDLEYCTSSSYTATISAARFLLWRTS